MSKRVVALVVLFLIVPLGALALLRGRTAAKQETATPSAPALPEAIADLQRRLDSNEVKLEFDERRGYLKSVLDHLKIPVSSQTLVFAKNSAQLFLISPETPRAIYFNDTVYVGYVPSGGFMEIASIDPELGPVFYALDQIKQDRPTFKHELTNCVVCHDTFTSEHAIPRLLMLSVLADPTGVALKRAALVTNDASPMQQRWGGWYVTGTHGNQRHLGNTVIRTPASDISEMKEFIKRIDQNPGANVTDLSKKLDTTMYPSPGSDIVALMVLGHQTHVHNLIAVATHSVTPGSSPEKIKEHGEPVVRSMLFADAVALTEPVTGTSDYAATFAQQGPRDSRGRSLRDLDLKQRLLRYPLSYLVYSKSFDGMSQPLKDYVYRRFKEILTGADTSKDFAKLSEADRQAILEILKETKPDFAALMK